MYGACLPMHSVGDHPRPAHTNIPSLSSSDIGLPSYAIYRQAETSLLSLWVYVPCILLTVCIRLTMHVLVPFVQWLYVIHHRH